nr:uncharacterized protein LOC122321641 [Drosophila bipectinata]
MKGYSGTAKARLDQVKNLNSEARKTYSSCVKPVFEWCVTVNITFTIFLPHIGSEKLMKHDRDELWRMTVVGLDYGLIHSQRSLALLILQQKKIELLEKIDVEQKVRIVTLIGSIFVAIGAVIFAPIGIGLGLAAAVGASLGLTQYDVWKQKTSYEDQINCIEKFFEILQEKIRSATGIVEDINNTLEKDITNLHILRGKISTANIKKFLLNFDSPAMQAQFVPAIKNVTEQCVEYINLHRDNSVFYENSNTETRRKAPQISDILGLVDQSETVSVANMQIFKDASPFPEDIGPTQSNS